MTRAEIAAAIAKRDSMLCVGLDPVPERLPEGVTRDADGVVDFCRRIIDATADLAVAYKPNLAFFEALGPGGMAAFAKTCAHVPETHFLIADAKRGDIGNTALRYAEAFYDRYGCHAVTVAPYMGEDSVRPFLREGCFAIVLGLTSNAGSADFEQVAMHDGRPLWEHVIEKCVAWGSPDELMLVTGATKADDFARIRELAPEHFLLVPGIGAQGGDLAGVLRHGRTAEGGLLINSSRGILYASAKTDFAAAARGAAQTLVTAMREAT